MCGLDSAEIGPWPSSDSLIGYYSNWHPEFIFFNLLIASMLLSYRMMLISNIPTKTFICQDMMISIKLSSRENHRNGWLGWSGNWSESWTLWKHVNQKWVQYQISTNTVALSLFLYLPFFSQSFGFKWNVLIIHCVTIEKENKWLHRFEYIESIVVSYF